MRCLPGRGSASRIFSPSPTTAATLGAINPSTDRRNQQLPSIETWLCRERDRGSQLCEDSIRVGDCPPNFANVNTLTRCQAERSMLKTECRNSQSIGEILIMAHRPFLGILFACASAGCAVGVIHLYPVEASSVAQPQNSIVRGNIIYALASATISFQLPDGEKFSGPCTIGSAAGVNDDLKGTWDSVYGHGDYLAHVVGSPNHCTATLTGSRGTVFHVESYNETAQTLKGIAQDSRGDIYKLGL